MHNKSKNLSRRARAYDELKQQIIFGRCAPGMVLNEKEICQKLKISRTPYREALLRLELEGLVLIKPKVGVVVTHTDFVALKDVFELRPILEGVAAQLVFKRMQKNTLDTLQEIVEQIERLGPQGDIFGLLELDAEFHHFIYAAQGNVLLGDMLNKLYNQCMRLWNTIGNQDQMVDLIRSSILDIKYIYQAFLNRDPSEAERLIKAHFSSYLHTLFSHLIGRTENGSVSRGT